MPVGALGTPIRSYWQMTQALVADVDPDYILSGGLAAELADHIEAMARRYAGSIDLAMTNSHVLRHAAAPVDVGDADVAGVTTLAARHFGLEEMRGVLEERSSRMDLLARVQVEIALEFASAAAGRG